MSKTTNTKEIGLEKHITDHLVNSNRYILRTSTDYDNVNCMDKEMLFAFLEETQPKALAKLKKYHKELFQQKIIKRINDQVKQKGIIEILRKGVTDGFTGVKLRLFFDKPVSNYKKEQ